MNLELLTNLESVRFYPQLISKLPLLISGQTWYFISTPIFGNIHIYTSLSCSVRVLNFQIPCFIPSQFNRVKRGPVSEVHQSNVDPRKRSLGTHCPIFKPEKSPLQSLCDFQKYLNITPVIFQHKIIAMTSCPLHV